jgi:NAD kinase
MDRIVLVTKRTRFEDLVLKYHTEGAARFDLESRGQSIDEYRREDAAYKAAADSIRQAIPSDIQSASVSREDLPNFLFRESDLVIVCGPDGLFANLAKYLGNQPVIGINPDPKTIAGTLMPFSPFVAKIIIEKALAGEAETEDLPFVKATVDNDKVIWGINDVFLGRRDHVSARYNISFAGQSEHHSSSGVLVSTGVGSTGWISSIANMVSALTGGRPSKLSNLPHPTDSELVFVTREPFVSPGTNASIITGRITPGHPLVIDSEMPVGGCIFSDGVVEKGIEWKAGSTVVISTGERFVKRVIA